MKGKRQTTAPWCI